jgi:hypothetical protein
MAPVSHGHLANHGRIRLTRLPHGEHLMRHRGDDTSHGGGIRGHGCGADARFGATESKEDVLGHEAPRGFDVAGVQGGEQVTDDAFV